MRRHLIAAALGLAALAAPVAAQEEGSGQVLDLLSVTRDLVFPVVDLGGKVQSLEVRETETEIRIELAADVLFDFDKADIRAEAAEALQTVGRIIRDHPGRPVRVEGHTDSKGSDSYNQKLSDQRAKFRHGLAGQARGLGKDQVLGQGLRRNPAGGRQRKAGRLGRSRRTAEEPPGRNRGDEKIAQGTGRRALVRKGGAMVASNRVWLLFGGLCVVAGPLFAAPAAADDKSDCAGSDPANGIPACTRLIEQAGATANTLADAYVNRAKLHLVASDMDRALADVEEALRHDASNIDAYHNRGVAFALQGRYDEALAALEESIRLNPNAAAESHHTRGRIYADLGNWDVAMAEFDAAIRIDPNHVDALISRAAGHRIKGSVERAIVDLDRALGIDPENAEAYASRGALYITTSRFAEGIADLDRAIALDPNGGRAYGSRGTAYLLQRQFDRAIVDFDRAIRLEPENGEFYLQRATAYAMQGKAKQAIPDFDQVIRRYPGHVRSYEIRAAMLKRVGRRDEAIADYRKVLALEPSNEQSKEALRLFGVEP